jgi:hypothetical protein
MKSLKASLATRRNRVTSAGGRADLGLAENLI